ncbi:MAG: hypothetical protein IKG84_07885 [Bacteroidales bacterium]|nr:hypothetical protein [Bacteroidales bacterium]
MDVKVVTVEGEPVDGAVVSLSSVPNNGTFPEIASLTDEQGMANVICEHVAGEYVFSVYTDLYGGSKIPVTLSGKEEDLPVILIVTPETE